MHIFLKMIIFRTPLMLARAQMHMVMRFEGTSLDVSENWSQIAELLVNGAVHSAL